jgi:hypothetical protein
LRPPAALAQRFTAQEQDLIAGIFGAFRVIGARDGQRMISLVVSERRYRAWMALMARIDSFPEDDGGLENEDEEKLMDELMVGYVAETLRGARNDPDG